MRTRIPRIRQHDVADCGVACLRSIAIHYGREVSISRLRELASTDRSGTNVMGLVEGATDLGFTAKGVRGTSDSLPRVPLPAIAHLKLENGMLHYVVIHAVGRGRITVMDPAGGEVVRYPLAEFEKLWTGVLVLLVPGESFEIGGSTSRALRILELVRPHRSVLAQAALGAAIYTVLGLSTALYVRVIVDHVLVDGNRNLLNLASAAMVVVLVLQIYFGTIKSLLTLRTGQKIDAALVLGYYRHLLRLPQRFFDTMRVGEVLSRMGDAVKIRQFINETAIDLLVNALVVFFCFALMFAYSWKLSLVVGLCLPAYAIVLWVTNSVNRRVLRSTMERAADFEGELVESIHAVATIKHFGLELEAEGRTEPRLVRLLRPVYRAGVMSVVSAQASEFISRLTVIALFWVGAGLVIDGGMTPGGLLSVYALLGYFAVPVTRLIGANRTIQDALIAADRLFEILDVEREVTEGQSVMQSLPAGDIRFDDVCFRYGNRRRTLEGLQMVLPRGRTSAIVGPSGSGKSTTLALLHKLYPIESGAVRIGDVDLRHLDTAEVRRRIVVVPQDVHMLPGSVLSNIVVGNRAPDLARVTAICRDLEINALIEELPAGYGTPLGAGGITLSAGQRQKIAIARALYCEPDVLVLDEASSHLDSIGEEAVQRCLRELRDSGTTVIIVAHRLATIAGADLIVVLEGGRVVEQGAHGQLLAAGGLYRSLWDYQHPRPMMPAGRRTEIALPVECPTA